MDATSTQLELKSLPRSNKSLRHKHKNNKRALENSGLGLVGSAAAASAAAAAAAAAAASAAQGNAKPKGCSGHHQGHSHTSKQAKEEEMRELLTNKIAELQLGGEEHVDVPVDITGIFLDDKLPAKALEAMEAIGSNDSLSHDDKMDQLKALVRSQSEQTAQLQEKISEFNAKHILLRQRKHTVAAELVKMKMTKEKLEQLCRELQKQNKTVISESRRIAEEEDIKRRELSNQFQKTIEEVGAKMDQQGKDYVASLKENESLQQKLKTFLEQYEAREEHFKQQLEAKNLNIQLVEAKLQHQVELTTRETEKAKTTLEKAKEFAEREVELQSQLNSYSEKFEVVQETLAKSNQMFVSFREEVDKMTKRLKQLEKENMALKTKCAQYDHGAIEAVQQKVQDSSLIKKQQDKIATLESLCRQLQAERKQAKEATTPNANANANANANPNANDNANANANANESDKSATTPSSSSSSSICSSSCESRTKDQSNVPTTALAGAMKSATGADTKPVVAAS